MKKSTQKDIITFYKGQEIAQNLVHIIEDKEGSTDAIDHFIATNPYSGETLEGLTNPESVHKTLSDYRRAEKTEGTVQLIKKIQRKKLLRRIKLATYSILSAASVLSAVTLILFHDQKENNSVKSDIALTSPTLQLGDGTKINLNNEYEIAANEAIIERKGEQKISLKKSRPSTEISYNTITVPSKFTYSVILEDSTEVFLNANSEFKYPTDFGSSTREVFLKGEGYFKVRKESRAFIVNASTIRVKVYGTEFNVNTNLRNVVETILVSGSVGVTINNNSEEVKMVPNQRFLLNLMTQKSELMSVDPQNYLGWLSDRFISDEEPLGVLLDKIALWYGVEFEYRNEEAIKNPVLVNLKRSSNIDSILKVISKISKVKFIKTDSNKYVVE